MELFDSFLESFFVPATFFNLSCHLHRTFNKLTSVFQASVLLLIMIMNFVMTLSK